MSKNDRHGQRALLYEEVEKLVQLAAETGTKAGIEAYRDEINKAIEKSKDRRLHNTEMLLRNYRKFRDVSEQAVYRAEDCKETLENILSDLMHPGRSENVTIQSIKSSAARTAIIVEHTEKMLGIYRDDCARSGRPEEERRWRVISGLYLDEDGKTVQEIAISEHVSERLIYDDRKTAISQIAIYMFGVDGINTI